MDIKHTQEPWKFLEQGDADEYCLVTADGLKWVIAFRINGEMMPDMQRANARRIVACVNACEGIPTPLLENIGKGMGPKWLEAKDQRDTAWEELRKIREAIKANPEESTFDEVERVVSQRDILLDALKAYVSAVAVGGGTDKQSIMTAIRNADNDARTIIAGYEAF